MNPTESRERLQAFIDSAVPRNTLGLLYGRRRIGKSTLLVSLVEARQGFYWEATRGEPAVQLARLGEALGAYLGVGRLSLDSWEEALQRLLGLGASGPLPVVLDEFGYVLEAGSTVDSVLASLLGPGGRQAHPGQARLILCGSAVAMMAALTEGEAALRGRTGVEIVMQPNDYREAARALGSRAARDLAARVFAVIGGVIGYATDMVDHDLPSSLADFDRWVVQRVLSSAATLHHEATTLMAEDPTLAAARTTMHHSILGAIANGSVTAGTISRKLKRPISNLDPVLKRLISAGFVVRHDDPARAQRPTYALADPFLQFHFAILEPHGALLRGRDPFEVWEQRLRPSFNARVRGPVFEEQARVWVRRFADPATLGGFPDHTGPSSATIDGTECQLDILVAAGGEGVPPSQREVQAIGEAKVGETVGTGHLRRLERARASLGSRAAHARLLLFAPDFDADLRADSRVRDDVELVDLDRLYQGS
ncbi:MAG: ATP-binding protein [Gemmatimonadales bacterium]|nr:MAG: ATP-binding protein [Gemmatimonadales bacterium]